MRLFDFCCKSDRMEHSVERIFFSLEFKDDPLTFLWVRRKQAPTIFSMSPVRSDRERGSCESSSSALLLVNFAERKSNPLTKTGFSEQRHQRAFWYIAVVLWYNGAALPASMVVDEVAPDV